MAEVKCEPWKYKTENASNCPFCGSNSVSVLHKEKRFIGYNGIGFKKIAMQVYCMCNICHAKGKPISYIGYVANYDYYDAEHLPIYSCGDKAIEAWNTRKPIEAVVDRLEGFLEEGFICSDCPYEHLENCRSCCEAGAFKKAIEIIRGKE